MTAKITHSVTVDRECIETYVPQILIALHQFKQSMTPVLKPTGFIIEDPNLLLDPHLTSTLQRLSVTNSDEKLFYEHLLVDGIEVTFNRVDATFEFSYINSLVGLVQPLLDATKAVRHDLNMGSITGQYSIETIKA